MRRKFRVVGIIIIIISTTLLTLLATGVLKQDENRWVSILVPFLIMIAGIVNVLTANKKDSEGSD